MDQIKKDDDLFSMIRHELKNGLNQLVLAEFSKYGNTNRIKHISEMIDEMITAEYILGNKENKKCLKHKY